MKKKAVCVFIMTALLIFTFSACVPGDGNNNSENPVGFFWGVWHGWIAPISLIMSIFKDNIRIYEVNNSGFWYDFGFYIAIISGFGGISLIRKKDK